jgi:hypothetical protein
MLTEVMQNPPRIRVPLKVENAGLVTKNELREPDKVMLPRKDFSPATFPLVVEAKDLQFNPPVGRWHLLPVWPKWNVIPPQSVHVGAIVFGGRFYCWHLARVFNWWQIARLA